MCQNKRPGRRGKLARQHRSGDFTHFSLFTGIGGIDLAAEWAGFTTVGQCELADYPTKVLEKHWPGVPRWRDIRDVTAESVRAAGITNITVLSGGFPCQPFSIAGRRDGKDDDRYLWPEMLQVIRELQPSWVLGENVAGLLSIDSGKEISKIIGQLENENYETTIILSPACNYGASFEGKRVFIVATTESGRYGRCASQKRYSFERELVKNEQKRDSVWGETERRIIQAVRHQETLPDYLRSDYGFPDWVDRLKCLGNAVVPQQVYPILKAIAEIESG